MSLYPYAIGYAKRNLPIFPCQQRGKEPASSRGVHDATSNLDRIHSWWGPCNDLNIGLACGEPSGLFIIDVDGAEGETTLRKLEEVHDALPPTREAITGRNGGRHAYFRLGKHRVRNSAGKLGAVAAERMRAHRERQKAGATPVSRSSYAKRKSTCLSAWDC